MKVCVAALTVLLLAAFCSQVQSQLDGVNTPTSCCFSYVAKPIPRSLVVKYRQTSSKCSQLAVIFTTKKGREVCSDPNARWVQEYIKHVKQN
ncbi:C-C motif chemokine 4-like [Emydura macquarii macquarii]|uniref:C-C motif chemokine 4-like n=1 Tax=Emydura macquarii macquarii TaxID=1129001 RepID=UPI00352B0C56